MKPSYQKLLQEFTKQRIFTPQEVRFDFSSLGNHPEPEYRDIDFIDRHKIFFSSYSKCLSHLDVARLFEKLSEDLNALTLTMTPEIEMRTLHVLSYLERLIACVKDEKMWLHFTAQEKLIDLLETCPSPKIVFFILKLLFSFLKTKLRVHELFLFNLQEKSKLRLIVLVHAWILGVNLCNSGSIANFNDKFQLSDMRVYSSLAFNPESSYNEESNLEKMISVTHKDLRIQPRAIVDLQSLLNLTEDEILEYLSTNFSVRVNPNSLNMLFLKIRYTIFNHIFPQTENGERLFNHEGHQRICLLSLVATNIVKSISRNSEMFEKVKSVSNLFDEFVFEKNDEFAIDNLESTLPSSFVDASTFRNTMIFVFNYYIYMNDSTVELNDRLKEFLSLILERVARATYLENKLTSVSDIDLRVCKFPVTNENIVEILRIVNLFYINESKIRNYHSGDYSSIFDVILGLQAYYNKEIRVNCSEEVLQILLEINRLVMNELEKDKDMVLLDIFVENLKFYLESYSFYRSTYRIVTGVYDNFLLLLFETIEAIDSYFIDPLKSQFLFNIPRVSRTILEADFWVSESLLSMMSNDDHFLFIFNELVVLLNDLLNEVAENYLPTFIAKFAESGLLKIIFDRFGKQRISNEYDSLGFLVNLLSKVHLHSKDFFAENEIEGILTYFTDQLILKEALLSNLKRFNTSDSHLALKNFSEELLELCNVHPSLIDLLMKVVMKQIKEIRTINLQISDLSTRVRNKEELFNQIQTSDLVLKKYGWFSRSADFSLLSDELMLWQKAIFNYIKFMIKFFDNHKTNIYQNFITCYDNEFGADVPFLDFVFEDCNISFMFSEFTKQKKLGAVMLKTSLITNNQLMVKKFREYLLQKVPIWQKELTVATGLCSDAEFSSIAAILHDKNRNQREQVSLQFECFSRPAQNYLKTYTSIAMGLECIRFFISNGRDTTNVNDFFRHFMNMQKLVMQADQHLVTNGGDVFFKMLFEELENQSLEYFFNTSRNQAFHSLQGFYKVLKYLRESSNIETLYELTHRIVRLRVDLEDKKETFPTYFIYHFANTIEAQLQSPIADSYSVIVIYFQLNCLQEFINLKKTFYEYNSFSNSAILESVYYLSKVGFFSKTLISVLRTVFSFIAKNHKTIKHLFYKRKVDNELYTKDIIRLFLMDDVVAKLMKIGCSMIEKLFEIKSVNIEIAMKDGSVVKEAFVKKVIDLERTAVINEISTLLKTVTPENFYCFELEDKIDKDDESKIKKTDKTEKINNSKADQRNNEFKAMSLGSFESEMTISQKFIPFKLEKNQALAAFLNEYESTFLFLFKLISEPNVELPVDAGTANPVLTKMNFFGLAGSSPEDFSNNILDIENGLFKGSRSKLTEEDILKYRYSKYDIDPTTEIPDREKFLKIDYYNEIVAKNVFEVTNANQKNFENLVAYFFTNFMKFKEGRKILKYLWKCFNGSKPPTSSTSSVSSMFESAQQSLRHLLSNSGKSKQKGEWKLQVKEKDPIYHILALQVDLLNLMPAKEAKEATKTYSARHNDNCQIKSLHATQQGGETQTQGTPSKLITSETVSYLVGILEEQLAVKQRRSQLQELIRAILELLAISDKTHDEKFIIIKAISNLFKLHKLWLNSKERTILINGRILKSLLALQVIIFHEDESFLERLAPLQEFKIFKSLLRLKSGKSSPALALQIKVLFRTLIESIIRQPHIVSLLFESELKSFLFKQTDNQYDLKKILELFGKVAKGNEKIFAHVFNKTCEVVTTAKNIQVARLSKAQDFTVRNNEVKPFVVDFISILMHDSLFKINQRVQKPDINYVFSHIIVSEALFFQILPRYPLFYSLNFPKEKLPLVVHFFEKALIAHPGYFSFLQPIFFESPLLVKDSSSGWISVTKMIRSEIINFIIGYVKKLKERLDSDLIEHQFSKIDEVYWLLLNVNMFIIQASKSELFNNEINQSELPSFLVNCFEEILATSVESKLFNKNHLASIMALPEILRRRQVVTRMNEEEIKAFEKRAMDVLLLNVPTTFRVSLEKWQTQRQKNSIKDYNISASTDINYTFFSNDRKSETNPIYRLEETAARANVQRHIQNDMTIFRPVFEEDMGEQGDDPEFWHAQGIENEDQESEGGSWQSESNESRYNQRAERPTQLHVDIMQGQLPQRTNPLLRAPGNEILTNDFMNINLNPLARLDIPMTPNQLPLQIPPLQPQLENQNANRMDIEHENHDEEEDISDEDDNNQDDQENEFSDEMDIEDSSGDGEDEEDSDDSEDERLDSDDEDESSENEDEIMVEIANDMGHNIDEEEDDDDDDDDDESEESDIGFMEDQYDEGFNQSFNEGSQADDLSREHEKQRIERQQAEPNHAMNLSTKIFETYPFVMPLNLSSTSYLYYNDAISEEYKDKISGRVLPYIGSRDEQLYISQGKEFKAFKSDFSSANLLKNRDRIFGTPMEYPTLGGEARLLYRGIGGRIGAPLNTRENTRVFIDGVERLNNDLRRNNTIFNSLDLQLEGLFNDLDRFNTMRRANLNPGVVDEGQLLFANRIEPNPVAVIPPEPARQISLMDEILKGAVIVNEYVPPEPVADNSQVKKEEPQSEEIIANSNIGEITPSPFLKKNISEVVNEPFHPGNLEMSQISSIPLQNQNSRGNSQLPNEELISNPIGLDIENEQPSLVQNNSNLIQEEKTEETKPLSVEKTPETPTQNVPVVETNDNQIIINEEEDFVSEARFNFSSFGLPDNFLEIADIDATFFNALPLEIQTETVLMIGSELNLIQPNATPRIPDVVPQNPNQNTDNQIRPENDNSVSSDSRSRSGSSHQQLMDEQNNNLLFVTSLSPELREEVLMTCPDEFLLSLPENIQTEARNLRDNAYLANWAQQQGDEQLNAHTPAGNLAANRIKKAIKKNKQRDAIQKVFGTPGAPPLYQVSPKILEAVLALLEDSTFSLKNLPIGYISSLLFNHEIQELFYTRLVIFLEGEDQLLQSRALILLEILCYSNFQYFQSKPNFDRFVSLLGVQKIPEKLINRFLKSVNHILKTTLSFEEKSETCNITITPLNLTHLTSVLHCKRSDFSEPLSMILFLLSFSAVNLELIVSNLQENIDRFAFNLNMRLLEILEDQAKSQETEEALLLIGKKIAATYDSQVRLLKIFKLLEQLFKRSFSQIFKQTETEEAGVPQEKTDQFDKIKQKVLTSFSSYFNQKNIRRVFVNLFKVLKFYETKIDKAVSKRQVSKPAFLKLLPLVESFFTIYKLLCDDEFLKSIKQNLRLADNASAGINIKAAEYTEHLSEASDVELMSQSSRMSNSKFKINDQKPEGSEVTIQSIFQHASKNNRSILNYLLGQTSKVSQSPLSVLIRHASRIVNFDIKRKYFSQSLQLSKSGYMLRLVVRRSNLFQDSYTQLTSKSGAQMRGKIHIRFQDEEGEDAGGVQREWFNSLSHEIFNPDYALFLPAAHGYAYQPSVFSHVNTEHLSYFKFVGKVVGKALFDGQLLDVHFTRSFYKHMTGTPLNYLDFEDYDPDYFRTLKWILENDVDDLDMDFSYQQDIFGKKEIKELKPNGRNIAVTNENKAEYIRLICEVKMTEEIRPQIQAFLEGLHSVIPHDLMKIFDPKELELMISGLPEIDLSDLRENTEYVNYTKDSVVIRNFWETLQNFDENLKAGFLQFVTGTSKVPFEGFQFLKGIGGAVQKFNIHKAYDTAKLPTTHTCMNQLDLPEYASKEELEERLKKAVLYGKEGFGFI
jgi:E3 ubiquitin-protein ligase HUWE1